MHQGPHNLEQDTQVTPTPRSQQLLAGMRNILNGFGRTVRNHPRATRASLALGYAGAEATFNALAGYPQAVGPTATVAIGLTIAGEIVGQAINRGGQFVRDLTESVKSATGKRKREEEDTQEAAAVKAQAPEIKKARVDEGEKELEVEPHRLENRAAEVLQSLLEVQAREEEEEVAPTLPVILSAPSISTPAITEEAIVTAEDVAQENETAVEQNGETSTSPENDTSKDVQPMSLTI